MKRSHASLAGHSEKKWCRYLPTLIDLIWNGKINPGKVFDLQLLLEQVAEGYRAMDERCAIKTLLCPLGRRERRKIMHCQTKEALP